VSIATQDRPATGAVTHSSRSTAVDNDAWLRVSVGVNGKPDAVVLSVDSFISTVQVGIVMSRAQLAAHRDAINAVLVSTEPQS
jgi:hypothetical protein